EVNCQPGRSSRDRHWTRSAIVSLAQAAHRHASGTFTNDKRISGAAMITEISHGADNSVASCIGWRITRSVVSNIYRKPNRSHGSSDNPPTPIKSLTQILKCHGCNAISDGQCIGTASLIVYITDRSSDG